MKRKLSLGIALSGNSKFLILDEPSSGVDAKSRRELWKILEKYKMGRTMLVSTHYMDEAEALSDKICIMAKGKLKYTGSCTDLKINRGRGYHLTISLPRLVFLLSDWLSRYFNLIRWDTSRSVRKLFQALVQSPSSMQLKRLCIRDWIARLQKYSNKKSNLLFQNQKIKNSKNFSRNSNWGRLNWILNHMELKVCLKVFPKNRFEIF